MPDKPSGEGRMEVGCLFGTCGLIYGAILGWVSLGVTGGGHGYNGAILAIPAIGMVPLVAAAWGFVNSRLVDLPLALILIYAAFCDICFFYGIDRERIAAAPPLLLAWYALWI